MQLAHCLLKVGDRAAAEKCTEEALAESIKVPLRINTQTKLELDIAWLKRKLKETNSSK